MIYFISYPQTNKVREDSWNLIQQIGGGGKINIGKCYENGRLAKTKRNLSRFYGLFKLSVRRFKPDDALFILIPHTLPLQGLFYRIILTKKMKLHIIMIDLDKARDSGYDDRLEKKVCMKAENIIAQTQQMKEYMLAEGYASEKRQTFLFGHFWPILTGLQPKGKSLFGNRIAFSGNLHKAPFFSKLTTLDSRLQFTVNPEFRMITEDWGLVWDGNSLETCNGRFGNYMKLVYPYKASLYLASNRPIIVWNQCAIADFVTKNHIGVAVSNLHEIYDAIHSLSDKDKEMMLENVEKWNRLIRTGYERIELMKLMINCQ